MARNTSAGLLNLTRDTPSRGVAHGLRTRSMRQSPTQQRRRGNGVVRSWAIARHKHLNVTLAADEITPLAVLGGLVLWLLRLALAPASTLAGFRAWVLDKCPTAPGRRADRPAPAASSPRAISPPRRRGRGRRRGDTKSARFLALVTEHHGPLAAIPLDKAAKIAATLAPQVDLNTGTARTVLRRAVIAAHAHTGDPS